MKVNEENLEHKVDKDNVAYLHIKLADKKSSDIYVTTESILYRKNDKPSMISYTKDGKVDLEIWTNEKGETSRLSGPAVAVPDSKEKEDNAYFIDSVRMTKEDHAAHPQVIEFNKLKNKKQ